MRFGKGTLLIVAASVVAAVVLGQVGGTVPGAFAAVAAGVAAAAVWQVRLDQRAGAERVAQLKDAEDRYALPGPAREQSVAQLLRPEEEVVSFRPRSELDQVVGWVADSEPHIAVQLVIGDGGTGKTRLARQVIHEIAGWRAQWVPSGSERGSVGTAREAGEPVLLVVDYAETRTGLEELLADITADTDGPDMRVLLLARSAGEWWQQLIDNSEHQLGDLLAALQPITLGPISDSAHQPDVFHEALAAFADKLGVECPNAELTLADPDAVVLVIHAAALLTVLDHTSDLAAEAPRSRADVLAGLLRHEARYWHKSQAVRGLGLNSVVERRAVAAMCLVGADDDASAGELLATIPDLADSAQQRGQVVLWLRDLYPVPQTTEGQQEWMGSLQPDLIAEQLIVSVLSEWPKSISLLFRGLKGKRAARALTTLARAALTDAAAEHQLDMALKSNLEHLAIPALAVAAETNPAMGDVIRKALVSSMPPANVLERIADALPYPSRALAETGAVVTRTLAEQAVNDPSRRAGWLGRLDSWLSDLGRLEEALAASGEAVTIYRWLVQDCLGAFVPELARSLGNQSVRLLALGRLEKAGHASDEALASYRRLTQDSPDASMPDLAVFLSNRSALLANLGQQEQALAASGEAVTIYRRLAQENSDAFMPGLARALNNYSNDLWALGRMEEALAAIEEALPIRRVLAQDRPDAYLSNLAKSLGNQGIFLQSLERSEEALAAVDESITIYRALAQEQPDAYLPDLAKSVTIRSAPLHSLELLQEAIDASGEGVTIYRRLAQDRPDAFIPDLARALMEQSECLLLVGRLEDAVDASQEAITSFRELAQDRPDAFIPVLARALNMLADVLAVLEREPEANAARVEAAELNHGT